VVRGLPVLLLVLEALFAAAIPVGVGFIYWPAGLIVAGVLGVLICERAATRLATRTGGG
jgi:hypothetical protein